MVFFMGENEKLELQRLTEIEKSKKEAERRMNRKKRIEAMAKRRAMSFKEKAKDFFDNIEMNSRRLM